MRIMKSVRLALIAFGLHYAAASYTYEESEDPESLGQSQDPASQAKFKQYAAAFLGTNGADQAMLSDFFSDDEPEVPIAKKSVQAEGPIAKKSVQHATSAALIHISDKEVKAKVRGTAKSVQHGATSTAQMRSGDKQTAHTGNVAAAVKSIATAKTVQASKFKISLTQAATSMQLKTQLAQAVQAQYTLRRRLKEVGTQTRKTLGLFLKQLKIAKAGSKRSEIKLRSEVQKANAKWKKAEASESELRKQLVAAKALALSARRAAAAASEGAVAKEAADRAAVRKLQKEFKKGIASLQREEAGATKSELRKQLAAALSTKHAAAKADREELRKLREELKASQMVAKTERDQLTQLRQVGTVMLQQLKPSELAATAIVSMTHAKAAPSHSTLQRMTEFLAKPNVH